MPGPLLEKVTVGRLMMDEGMVDMLDRMLEARSGAGAPLREFAGTDVKYAEGLDVGEVEARLQKHTTLNIE